MRWIHCQAIVPILLSVATLSVAFTPSRPMIRQQPSPCQDLRSATHRIRRFLSSQWEEEETTEDVATAGGRTTFEDAGESLQKEDDDERTRGMGDFDANPSYKPSDIERVREAIKARTEALGIEKSKVSAEAIKAAQERAQQAVANRGLGGGPDQFTQLLDLSQISDTEPRGPDGEELPAMFFEPEKLMTEEEMREADPSGQLPWPERVKELLAMSEFPTPGGAFKELVILVFAGVISGVFIVGLDYLLREFYTNVGLIPRPEDIMQGSDSIALPEGWTNNMSEEDFMKYQEEVGGVVKSATSTIKSATSTIKSNIPDL